MGWIYWKLELWNVNNSFKLQFTGNECCERLAYYGISTNLVLYFKKQLNQHSATASKNVSDWSGTCYITPLIGAFLADSYLGRYWTIACFSIIYVIVSKLSSICTWSIAVVLKKKGYNFGAPIMGTETVWDLKICRIYAVSNFIY